MPAPLLDCVSESARFGPVPSAIIHASLISEMHHSMTATVGTDAVKSRCCRVHILGWGASLTAIPPRHLTPPKKRASGHEISERPTRRIEATVTRLNAPHIGPSGFQGRGTGDRITSDSLRKRDDMVSRVTSPYVPPLPGEPKGLFETW